MRKLGDRSHTPFTAVFLFRLASRAAHRYDIAAGNAFGAIVNVAGGGPFTADPWSNLEY